MAFDDLTPNQIKKLTQLIEALNSGNYSEEFDVVRRLNQQSGYINLYGNSGVSNHEIEGFTNSEIQALKEEGYITLIGSKASLKPKAFQQYKLLKDPLDLFPTLEDRLNNSMPSLDIFISHSSKDKDIAEALINLLKAALNIPADRIRCTSVDGYRLPAGASTDEQLRREIYEARTFIGLITPTSFQSTYVLFELGARWGARLHLAPVLAAGIDVGALRGPLTGLNALSCDVSAQVFQLINDIASSLKTTASNPSAYQKHVDTLVEYSKTKREQYQTHTKTEAITEASVFTTSEEKDFQFIHQKLNRDIRVSCRLSRIEADGKTVTQIGDEIFGVNLVSLLLYYVNKGNQYFDYMYLNSYLNKAFKEQLLKTDSAITYGFVQITEKLGTELKTFGLVRHTKKARHDSLEDAIEFTEKMYRFKYWLDYYNLPIEEMSFKYLETLEPKTK
jgi:hypothetical protein